MPAANAAPAKRPGLLEVFSGCGVLALAFRELGGRAATIDIAGMPSWDLLLPKQQAALWACLATGEFQCVHLGPPCASFSVARTPPVRSAARPAGLRNLAGRDLKKVRDGNALAALALSVMRWAREHGIVAMLEQPVSSWMWKLAGFREAVGAHPLDSVVVLDYCQFRAPWRKATRLWGVNCDLEPLRRRCRGGHTHTRLRGRPGGGTATQLAQAYPARLAAHWAACLMGAARRQRNTAAGEDHSGTEFDATLGYPGEGPAERHTARRSRRNTAALAVIVAASFAASAAQPTDATPRRGLARFGAARQGARDLRRTRVGPGSQRLRAEGVARLRQFWQESGADPETLVGDVAACAALTSDWVQACYGGGLTPLHVVRNALLGLHDEWPHLRGALVSCWQDLRSWEDGEPFALRRPWPCSLVRATICLALAWGWWHIATALWVGFHCMLRPGEICALPWRLVHLACCRKSGRRPVGLQAGDRWC